MTELDLNRERGRSKARMRRNWAMLLIRPQTLKLVIKVGQWVVKILHLVLLIAKVFRE